ncbi:MAG TPA: HAMP domain-containing sensor histidine kinase, partial [Acidimicrobiia bacterium]|nr:HAMP domain-containing sensor histidine kinase [Acidimicrobiia bacterium]
RAVNIARLAPVSPGDELFSLIHLIGVTDDRNAVVIEDTTDAARFSTEQRAAFEELSMSAVLKYPIVVGARVAGALVVSEQTGSRSWSDGEVGLMEGFAREIGRALDHALAYQLQNQMVERLGVLDRSKNDFLSEVSRELRGPLASVLGYIELLTDEASETVTDEQRRMLGIVERNGEQLLELIADLLTMSKMEAGEFEPKLASVDLDRVIAQAWDAIAPAAANGGLTLQLNVEPGIELDGDEKQIERALRNILLNAVKFTPGGGRIDLFARVEGGEILLQVRDTGVGIAARELDDLFTRFFSASGVRRRETFGAGLGLYIVKQIVDGHAGSVSVASVLGHGSTFTMRFPVRPKHPSRRASDERLVRS